MCASFVAFAVADVKCTCYVTSVLCVFIVFLQTSQGCVEIAVFIAHFVAWLKNCNGLKMNAVCLKFVAQFVNEAIWTVMFS